MTPSVSVVIPTSGRSARLSQCLSSLAAQTRPADELFLVASRWDQAVDVPLQAPPAKIIPNPGTFSFARAANRGIAACNGEWVLLLNDDVVLEAAFLEELLSGISGDPAIGMACGKLFAPDGRRLDSTGQFLSASRTARERGYHQVDRGQFDVAGKVFSVPGALALYRRGMLAALAPGGAAFNESFGTYLEDLDLGWRAQRAGWRARYVPSARAFHERGATARDAAPKRSWLRRWYLPWLSPKRQARYVLNRYRLMRENDSLFTLLKNGLWILGYEIRLWSYMLCFEPRTVVLLRRTGRWARRAAIPAPRASSAPTERSTTYGGLLRGGFAFFKRS